MLTVYHVPRTRSVRILWLCEELGLEYRVVSVDFSARYRMSPEWLRMNPVGKVPVLTDDDLTLFESGAIVQYLLDRYGSGALQPPPGTPEHARYLQWSWFAEATFARPLGEIVNHRRVFAEAEQSRAAIEEMQARARLCIGAVEQALEGRAYILGDEFTAADIMMGYSLMLTDWLVPGDAPDNVARYKEALFSRPAYRKAVQTP